MLYPIIFTLFLGRLNLIKQLTYRIILLPVNDNNALLKSAVLKERMDVTNLNERMFTGPGNQTHKLLDTRLDVLPTEVAGPAHREDFMNDFNECMSARPGYQISKPLNTRLDVLTGRLSTQTPVGLTNFFDLMFSI